MRIFKDLELVEHLGTGIRRILKKYDSSIYKFYPHFIIVSIKYNDNDFEYDTKKTGEINHSKLIKVQQGIISLIETRPTITQEEIANLLGVTSRTIRNHIKFLVDNGYIQRSGADKKGKWIITN